MICSFECIFHSQIKNNYTQMINNLLQHKLGRRVREKLEDALEGAEGSRSIISQASYCRKIIYVPDKCSQNYTKSTSSTWKVNSAIVHNLNPTNYNVDIKTFHFCQIIFSSNFNFSKNSKKAPKIA